MDFGPVASTNRKGMRRFIPISNRIPAAAGYIGLRGIKDSQAKTTPLAFKFVDATMGNGIPLHCDVGRDSDNEVLNLTRPQPLTGVNQFTIDYKIANEIRYVDGVPNVRWNVTGNQVPFAIDHAQAAFHLPDGVPAKSVACDAFRGGRGKGSPLEVSRHGNDLLISADALKPGESLIFSVQLPKGAIAPPAIPVEWLWFLQEWYEVILLPMGTALMLFFYWWGYGRDKVGEKPLGVWEPPKELTPAEVGTLIDESCDFSDITSTLIDLAARGHLTIKQIPYNGILMMSDKDYVFTKTTPPGDDLPLKLHESFFLDAIFPLGSRGSRLSDLNGRFQPNVETLTETIYNQLLSQGYFARNPEVDRHMFTSFGVMILVVGLLFTIFGGEQLRSPALGFMLSGVLVAVSSSFMPARTALGSRAYNQCLAFRQFVRTAQRNSIQSAVNANPAIFGRLLPYAMVMGCADAWANGLKDFISEPPAWYSSEVTESKRFSAADFMRDLGSSMLCINACFGTPPTLAVFGRDADSIKSDLTMRYPHAGTGLTSTPAPDFGKVISAPPSPDASEKRI